MAYNTISNRERGRVAQFSVLADVLRCTKLWNSVVALMAFNLYFLQLSVTQLNFVFSYSLLDE